MSEAAELALALRGARTSVISASPSPFTAQYSNSTDEGLEPDLADSEPPTIAPPPPPVRAHHPRLASYASSSSSSGVASAANKSLSQHLSSESGSSNLSATFESCSLDYQLDAELATSLPSCTSPFHTTAPPGCQEGPPNLGGTSTGALAPRSSPRPNLPGVSVSSHNY